MISFARIGAVGYVAPRHTAQVVDGNPQDARRRVMLSARANAVCEKSLVLNPWKFVSRLSIPSDVQIACPTQRRLFVW
ncbi:hypothetical protein [Bradyrhizobium cenepequi]|jgi:hypothetical protein